MYNWVFSYHKDAKSSSSYTLVVRVESAGVVVTLILQLLYYSAKMLREPLIAGTATTVQSNNAQPPINFQIKACVKQKREVARANGGL